MWDEKLRESSHTALLGVTEGNDPADVIGHDPEDEVTDDDVEICEEESEEVEGHGCCWLLCWRSRSLYAYLKVTKSYVGFHFRAILSPVLVLCLSFGNFICPFRISFVLLGFPYTLIPHII